MVEYDLLDNFCVNLSQTLEEKSIKKLLILTLSVVFKKQSFINLLNIVDYVRVCMRLKPVDTQMAENRKLQLGTNDYFSIYIILIVSGIYT